MEGEKQKESKHSCDQCEASFTRLEHLRRHQTMHTRVKAFTCVFCFKDFARSDVLRRHYQSCKLARRADATSIGLSRRVNRACISCRQSKLKCSGQQPCQRCDNLRQGHLCRFTLRKLRNADDVEANEARNTILAPNADGPPISSGLDAQSGDAVAMEVVQGVSVDPSIHDQCLQAGAPAADEQVLGPARLEWVFESGDSAVDMASDQATGTGARQPHLLAGPSVANAASNTFNPSDFDLSSPGMFLDLDLLDYGILDSSLMMLNDRGPTGSATTVSADESGTTPPDHGERQGEQRGTITHDLPKGMRLMQISPLDAHRTQLLQYLQESPLDQRRWDRWLSTENMSRYLKAYFGFFHRHTPLLHLPSWNISTTSTRLLFSMLLMGAMYSEDLNSQSATDRQLCHVAQTFAWDTDPGLLTGPALLDTIQAVYIATLVEAFYFPAKRHRPTVDTKRLLAEARRSGLFSPNRALKEPWKMKWSQWCVEESRKRTTFILYLFDAIQTIFFDQHPHVHLHELRLPLPCDESIYSAETEEKWSEMYTEAQDLAKVEYPVLLALFVSHRPIEIELNLSVMGAFIVLHGILLHVWEQQRIHKRDDPTDIPDDAEKSMREHLWVAQGQAADNALQLWFRQCNKTVSRPASTESDGLYRDRALVYWFLGNLMNQCPDPDVPESSEPLVNGQWRMKIPGLLRRLAILVDSGRLNSTNGAVTSIVREMLASQLGDLNESVDTDAEGETMDTITMRYIMRKEEK